MTRRKGIQKVERWTTSDGREFASVKEANNHQGAINELDRFFEAFKVAFLTADNPEYVPAVLQALRGKLSDDSDLRVIIYTWEHYKAAHDPATMTLLPEQGVKIEQIEQAQQAPEQIEQASEPEQKRSRKSA